MQRKQAWPRRMPRDQGRLGCQRAADPARARRGGGGRLPRGRQRCHPFRLHVRDRGQGGRHQDMLAYTADGRFVDGRGLLINRFFTLPRRNSPRVACRVGVLPDVGGCRCFFWVSIFGRRGLVCSEPVRILGATAHGKDAQCQNASDKRQCQFIVAPDCSATGRSLLPSAAAAASAAATD